MFAHENGVLERALPPKQSAKEIAEISKHVEINNNAISKLSSLISEKFISREFSLDNWRAHELHPNQTDNDAVDFIFAVDILNFSFWPSQGCEKFKVAYKGKEYTGYWSLVAAVKRAQDRGIPFCSAEYMSKVTDGEIEEIFKSDFGVAPLLKERRMAMNEAGKVLLEKFEGSFVNCLKKCDHDVVELLKMLTTNITSLQDISYYGDKVYSFLKRAQIIVADVWGCFQGEGLGHFKNIEEVTMFADYRVPQTLEYFEILKYSGELKQKLNSLEVMEKDCIHEIEIRGCSIHAVELLRDCVLKELAEKGANKDVLDIVNSITLDFFLWDFARAHRKEMNHLQFHRVRTIYY